MPTSSPRLITGCALCNKTGGCMRCSRCKIVQYCCRGHQVQHRDSHKKACNTIARELKNTNAEEGKLRSANVFETGVGHFFELVGTVPYMQARYKFVAALREVNTRQSVELQLLHLKDMLRLSGFDNMDLRPLVPGTMLRLEQDQECYDFMKRWQTALNGPDFMVDASKPPYAAIKDCNSFEPTQSFCDGGEIELPFKVGLTLIKTRLLLDLLALRAARALAIPQNTPREILDIIRAFVVRTDVITNDQRLFLFEDYSDKIDRLREDILGLWDALCGENQRMWKMLLNPVQYLDEPLNNDQEQAQLALAFTHKAWAETPYALDVVKMLERRVTT